MWAKVIGGNVQEIITQPKSYVDGNGIQHSSSVFRLWSVAELKAINIYPLDVATPVNTDIEIITGTTYVYDSVQERVSENHTTSPKSLRAIKEVKNKKINDKRENVINGDIDATINATVYTMETDKESRDLLSGTVAAVAAGYSLPVDFSWRTRDNISVAMDSIKLAEFRDAVTTHVNDCFKQSWIHKAGLDAIADQARIDLSEEAIKYKNDGYPAITTPYPLVAAKAAADLTSATTAADAVIAEDITLAASLVAYDETVGWPANSAPEAI